ncbi:putative ABC transporter, permease protein (fragment) [Bradyrhizobium sp. ORS 278]
MPQGSAADTITSIVAYLGVSLPEFVTATVLAMLLTDVLPWLPATGYVSPLEDSGLALRHLALPVLTVSVILVAHVMRMMRSETLDVLQSDYVRAARRRGCRSGRCWSATSCATRCCRSSPSLRSTSAICSEASCDRGDLSHSRDRPCADDRDHHPRSAVDPGRRDDHGRDLRDHQHARGRCLRAARPANPL